MRTNKRSNAGGHLNSSDSLARDKSRLLCPMLICLALIINITPVNASFTAFNTDKNVTVTGASEEEISGVPITLLVLALGKDIEDLQDVYDNFDMLGIKEALCYFDETITGEDGSYTFKFQMDSAMESGDYSVIVREGASLTEGILRYISIAQKVSAVETINSSLSQSLSKLIEVLSDNSYALELFVGDSTLEALYNSVKDSNNLFNAMKKLGTYRVSESDINSSITEIKSNLNKAVVLSVIQKSNDIDEINRLLDEYEGLLSLNISGKNADNCDFVAENIMKLTEITEISQLQASIDDSLILYDITNSSKWGDIKSVLDKYKDFLGISLADTDVDYSKVYHKMFEEKSDFSNTADIVSKFNQLKNQYPKETGQAPSPPASGSGGGGISSAVRPVPVAPVKQEDEIKQIFFDDVGEEFWAKSIIDSLAQRKILNGKSEKIFAPTDNVTREEFLALLFRALGIEHSESKTVFSDVEIGSWYENTVATAYSLGIAKGHENGSFGIGTPISREDMAVFCERALAILRIDLAKTEQASAFADMEQISPYAKSAVLAMQNAGIISGFPNNTFAPKNNTLRAEAAAVIYKILLLKS